MSFIEILILGLALSMDAFAVTISNLMAYPYLSRSRKLALPLTFGVFQGLMLLIGFFAGSLALDFIKAYAGPIALVILTVIGGKMIFDAIRSMRKDRAEKAASFKRSTPGRFTEEALPASKHGVSSSSVAGTSEEPAITSSENRSRLSLVTLLFQGVATSLDALIVGVSLGALGANIFVASPLVGVTTFLVCVIGLIIGKRVGILLGARAEIVGGVILILIGVKVCFF